ncbi:glycosyltransferase family 2 protein [Parasedimentitalea marina]|uniref:Glycosyltransferase family 2 protein n=1 Tax=Parasedimentitalea marina TaxID=2483033 RepID=A0A3T0N7Q9_9RHOB|nr:glycosyltransferase family 2 protein [Parasedimentitalea marina]
MLGVGTRLATTSPELTAPGSSNLSISWREAYQLRWRRRRALWKSYRSRHHLRIVKDLTGKINPDDILAVSVLRNEITRLPFFLDHYRHLGVSQFLVVDNNSNDGSAEYLAAQPDVSVWHTAHSYHASRFGLDWLTWLQIKYAHGHWCLMVDADELLIYTGDDAHNLRKLTAWLDGRGQVGFGALMLDLYPKGPLDQCSYRPGQDPRNVMPWFDPSPYRVTRQAPLGNLWVQGGARARMFFGDNLQRAPTLNKIPLVKWNRRYAYVNSTHSMLPPQLNFLYDGPGGQTPSGILLHTKFLPEIVSKSAIEKQRQQHFHAPGNFDHYYDSLSAAPDLWHQGSVRLDNTAQLEDLGLMCAPDW